jgi:flagellar protein FliO/FliZ
LNTFGNRAAKLLMYPFIFAAFTQIAFAASGDNSSGSSGSGFESFMLIAKVIFYLLLIIAIFYVIIRFVAKRSQLSPYKSAARSLGGVPLGQNKSIQIVEIGRSIYIVGVGDDIRMLDKIEDQEEIESLKEKLKAGYNSTNFVSFSNWIKNLRNEKSEEEEITSSFQQVFYDKLQGVSNRKKQVEDFMQIDKSKERLNDDE